MAGVRWSDVEEWVGTVSFTQTAKRKDDFFPPSRSIDTMRVHGTVRLRRDDGGTYRWTGTEQATATITHSTVSRWSFGQSIIKVAGTGTFDGATALQFGVNPAGDPVDYQLQGGGGDITVRGFSHWDQVNVGENTDTVRRLERASQPSTPFTPLPAKGTTLSGSASVIGHPDLGTLTWRLQPVSALVPRTVTVWMKEFLPFTLGADILRVVPAGRYRGQTAIAGYSFSPTALHLTDQRGFSPDRRDAARLRRLFEIDLLGETLRGQEGASGRVTEVRADGAPRCGPMAATSDFHDALDVAQAGEARRFDLEFGAAMANPCWPETPDLGFEGAVHVVTGLPGRVTVTAEVTTDAFTAFEMYANVNGGPASPVLMYHPDDPPGNARPGDGRKVDLSRFDPPCVLAVTRA